MQKKFDREASPSEIKLSKRKYIIKLPVEDDPRAPDLEDLQFYLKQEHQKELGSIFFSAQDLFK